MIEILIERANNAADAMEGADLSEFIEAEVRMTVYIEILKELGVKYDPMTGTRQLIRPPSPCPYCAPEFDCWSNPIHCLKPSPTSLF